MIRECLTSYLLSRLPPSVTRWEIVRRYFLCPIAEAEAVSLDKKLNEERLKCLQLTLLVEQGEEEIGKLTAQRESLRLTAEAATELKRFAEGALANWQRRATEAEREIETLKSAADKAALYIEELDSSEAGLLRQQLLASQQAARTEMERLSEENRTLRRDNEDLRSRVVLRADEVGAVEEP